MFIITLKQNFNRLQLQMNLDIFLLNFDQNVRMSRPESYVMLIRILPWDNYMRLQVDLFLADRTNGRAIATL